MSKETPDATILFSTAYHKRVRHGETGKECAVCGKQTNESFFVEHGDLGFFPVGPECFKKAAAAGFVVKTREQLDA